uniref:Uncharacterized protein n=1 Tax=Rhizochromulina marina TaxID=1034831 RepID=A0A7S2RN34_9STRA|mmetsp:Transcript_18138/g.53001  ORF Transcript_18138/g.53001 Transcript_18138/m.53001 type:complete len:608 (+) Transcript_18138:63-1886(+)|eukprot:CAMPEP_0118979906 /NCGR_PEP_ID=MMETSP1173-20130426/26991_1 /TAXON_ID=1034831 /ORGANISM="Rhizochromulina marina cf, Strain CCMP1243" /LENGTH=607 /DNA_ID=CAMNT_0006930195 /DNA_START=18 /DNA_END=1841 /DNA_ORIENTATION=-
MGFAQDNVLSENGHTAEFTCAICQQLVESPMFTACSHVFCGPCIEEWFRRARRCPLCNNDLSNGSAIAPLQKANPLAYRILLRIRVRCPLHTQGCTWQGDLSEVQAHLTNSAEHLAGAAEASTPGGATPQGPGSPVSTPSVDDQRRATAVALKEQGNSKFEARRYQEAIQLYSKALSLQPDEAALFSNRAAALFMLRLYSQCVEDCNKAINLRPDYTKAHLRRSKALVELGRFEEAESGLQTAHKATGTGGGELLMEYERVSLMHRQLDKAVALCASGSEKDFTAARTALGDLLRDTNAPVVVLHAARAELGLGLCDRALRLTLQVLRADKANGMALRVRAQAMYLSEEFDQAKDLLKEALRLDPDNPEAKELFRLNKTVKGLMDEARQAIHFRRFTEAIDRFGEVLEVVKPPKHAPIGCNAYAGRSTAHLRLKHYDECLRDAAKAIYGRDDCREAWISRTNALHALGRHQEALDDMTSLMQRWGSSDTLIRHAYDRADFEVRKSKRPDYYAIIGVPSVASESEIKSEYRRRALEWHPDKWEGHSAEEKARAEEKFKELGEILEVLTDPFKRQLYDEGYDKEAIEQRVAAAQRAAREPERTRHHHQH